MNREYLSFLMNSFRLFLIGKLEDKLSEDHWRDAGFARDILDVHLLPDGNYEAGGISDIFSRLLVSAQNRQDGPRVVLGSVDGGLPVLKEFLCGLDPQAVADRWDDPDKLFLEIRNSALVSGKMRSGKRSWWPRYCATIISAAHFLRKFDSANAFFTWTHSFEGNVDLAAALPVILSHEIRGFGIALACDFLKEIGLKKYPKPDVHIIKLAIALRLSNGGSPYMILRELMSLEGLLDEIGVTLYGFDKYLWLVGSGRFHKVTKDGSELSIGRCADEFITRWEGGAFER